MSDEQLILVRPIIASLWVSLSLQVSNVALTFLCLRSFILLWGDIRSHPIVTVEGALHEVIFSSLMLVGTPFVVLITADAWLVERNSHLPSEILLCLVQLFRAVLQAALNCNMPHLLLHRLLNFNCLSLICSFIFTHIQLAAHSSLNHFTHILSPLVELNWR